MLYWPYDEVSISGSDDRSQVIVSAPWIQATLAVTDENKPALQTLMQKFADKSLSADDLGLINWFFKDFAKYPFCYILPSEKPLGSLDHHALIDGRLLTGSLRDVLVETLKDDYSVESDITPADIDAVIARLYRQRWDWDCDAAIAFAKIGDKIHPESVFSVSRRYHLLDVLETSKARTNFNFIEGLKGDDFALAAGLMVRQNHYVTQKCNSALLPAVGKAGHAASIVESFIKEENGHDRILNVAMKSFSEQPDSVPVSVQTKALMHLLKFAAQRSFLGFAMAVDCFERSSYEKTDPLAQLLIKGGFEKAAKQINRHMDINDAGEHENVACTFLEFMAPCEPEYAIEALRIAELITLVMNSLTESTIDIFERIRNGAKV